jgi:DNA processing protein
MQAERLRYLALHLGRQSLNEKTQVVLSLGHDLDQVAHILLGTKHNCCLDEAARLIEDFGDNNVLTYADDDYPKLLREISHAPFAVFLRGNRGLLLRPLVSIVGTRAPSESGRVAAANLAEAFVAKGYTIVSGIARGIDSIAHHAALAAGGTTIAVLPNGFEHLYPLENRDLYTEVSQNPSMLFVSEYLPTQKPQKHHFVRRNRIIAGLSSMTVFAEGDIPSGGMMTVNHALAEGRDVAALDNSKLLNNAGGQKLIRDGAIDLTRVAFSAENPRLSA